ncbi:hypothetical protein MKLM6_0018 [Methylomonas koyamae]|nr:hypothetical protein MKLM6_0018 [Methylomonas koyamae]
MPDKNTLKVFVAMLVECLIANKIKIRFLYQVSASPYYMHNYKYLLFF